MAAAFASATYPRSVRHVCVVVEYVGTAPCETWDSWEVERRIRIGYQLLSSGNYFRSWEVLLLYSSLVCPWNMNLLRLYKFFGDANLNPPTDGRLVTPGELKWGAIKNFGGLGVLPIFSNIQPVQRQSAFRNVIHLANNLNKQIPRCSWMTKDWIIYGRLGNRQEYKIAPSQPLKLAPAAPTPSSCCYTSPRNNSPTTLLPADHHLPSTLIRWLCILH